MKAFACDKCGSLVFFENVQCVKCESVLGFLPDELDVSALTPAPNNLWKPLSPAANNRLYRPCSNGTQHQVCNWYVPEEDPNPLCVACRPNKVIPDLSVPGNKLRWDKLERAKHLVIYSLIELGLPLEGVPQENRPSLQFSFLADQPGGPPVTTGHQDGLITLRILEADPAERERVRVSLHEPFRTLAGHFRHEVAHYFWDRLIARTNRLGRFRKLFGDETADYAAALKAHYENGPSEDWRKRCITAYAASHPWEDWAETWAHYMHMVDTTETAVSFGLSLRPDHPAAPTMTFDPKKFRSLSRSIDATVQNWTALTYTLNTLNRGMGLPDLYPFVLSDPVVQKLKFIHEVVRSAGEKAMV